MTAPTWHHDVTARWWAEFNTSGPEIEFFRQYVEAGQPALDLGCGTGRLLIPYLREGLDADGCDVSADMIDLCRESAEREGLVATLYTQPKHQLDLPRRYRTIFMCGALGVGSTRAEDMQSLDRVFDHLEPGRTFVFDNEVPYADGNGWELWPVAGPATFSSTRPGGRPDRPAGPGDRIGSSSLRSFVAWSQPVACTRWPTTSAPPGGCSRPVVSDFMRSRPPLTQAPVVRLGGGDGVVTTDRAPLVDGLHIAVHHTRPPTLLRGR